MQICTAYMTNKSKHGLKLRQMGDNPLATLKQPLNYQTQVSGVKDGSGNNLILSRIDQPQSKRHKKLLQKG
jgi:hypothetical protein